MLRLAGCDAKGSQELLGNKRCAFYVEEFLDGLDIAENVGGGIYVVVFGACPCVEQEGDRRIAPIRLACGLLPLKASDGVNWVTRSPCAFSEAWRLTLFDNVSIRPIEGVTVQVAAVAGATP